MTCLSYPDLICLDATDSVSSQLEGSEQHARHLKKSSEEKKRDPIKRNGLETTH